MKITVNIVKLLEKDILIDDEISPEELDFPQDDECVQMSEPIHYSLTLNRRGNDITLLGKVSFTFDCLCVRCLTPFKLPCSLEVQEFLTLAGEDKIPVKDDTIDLTSVIRENIILECPRYPLCDKACNRLPISPKQDKETKVGTELVSKAIAVWSELDKLKLN